MSQNSELTKAVCLISLVFLLSLVTGCISGPTILSSLNGKPESDGYLSCSEYPEILDIWKTPDGFWVQLSDRSYPSRLYQDQYETWVIGQHVRFGYGISRWQAVDLIPVNESESGFRDACRVV